MKAHCDLPSCHLLNDFRISGVVTKGHRARRSPVCRYVKHASCAGWTRMIWFRGAVTKIATPSLPPHPPRLDHTPVCCCSPLIASKTLATSAPLLAGCSPVLPGLGCTQPLQPPTRRRGRAQPGSRAGSRAESSDLCLNPIQATVPRTLPANPTWVILVRPSEVARLEEMKGRLLQTPASPRAEQSTALTVAPPYGSEHYKTSSPRTISRLTART
jgi:hypothetical protein